MKNLFTLLTLGAACSLSAQTLPDEDALENVIVEKYYVAGEGDVQSSLPAGATTYRVYLDLKPGYEVQQVIGTIPHPLTIGAPGGGFYNSEFGSTFGSDFLPLLLNFGTASLDSYVTIKASTQTSAAIIKTLDTDGSVLTGADGYLQNVDPTAGISVLESDGFIPISGNVQSVSQLGIGDALNQYFSSYNSVGPEFTTENGAWFNLDGIQADTEENLVLLGQFTTLTCEFNFKLNIQVIIPQELQTGGYAVIRFVAETHPEDEELNASNDNFYIYQKDFLNYNLGDECLVSAGDIDEIRNAWAIVPNPASDILNLSFTKDLQDVSYAIYDLSGKLLSNSNRGNTGSNSMVEVNTQHLESGIYLLQLRSAEAVSVKKFVIAR